MSVFVSYARPDEPRADRVAEALRAAGYEVWRDDELPAHRAYFEVIEERLNAAKAVVVLWSVNAAKSQWVRAEADAARNRSLLVHASLDGTVPPIPFNQIQCADLGGDGELTESRGWAKLIRSVNALAGEPKAAKDPAAPERRKQVSICVLPFSNMSGDSEQEYFSDGIAEDITTDLSKVSALEVTARNTAFTFKGGAVDVREVARKLGVSHVLEGSVRKANNRVRISAQLINGQSGAHLWADRFDRDLTDIFAIQDEISHAIVEALKVSLLPNEKRAIERRGTADPAAYDLYLMARNHWATGNHGDVHREERVIRLCERAIQIDPEYADAWALLAIAQSSRHHAFGLAGDDGVEAAKRALAINPSLAEAHCPIIRRHIENREFLKAEEAVARALIAGADSWEVHHEAMRNHVRQRNFEQAAYHLRRQVSAMESDYYGWGMLLSYEWALGHHEEVREVAERALQEADKALDRDGNNGAALSVAARALASLGQKEQAREVIERGLMIDPDNLNMLYNFGATYAAQIGDEDAAFSLIERAITQASGTLISWVEIDPDVDSMREDPRFKILLENARSRLSDRQRTRCEEC